MFDKPFFDLSLVPKDEFYGSTRIRDIAYQTMTKTSSVMGIFYAIVINSFILLAVLSVCISTLPEYRIMEEKGLQIVDFFTIETACIVMFTIDYVCRLLCVAAQYANFRKQSTIDENGTVFESFLCTIKIYAKFVFNPLNIIDLIAIIPYYVTFNSGYSTLNLQIIRVLRLTRFGRLFKTLRYFPMAELLLQVMLESLPVLLILMLVVGLFVIFFSSFIFICEEGEFDPMDEKYYRPTLLGDGTEESPFKSIPHSMWYSIITMTTVGYGDYYPTTKWGKTIGTVNALLGIFVLALPITVVTNSFNNQMAKKQEMEKKVQNQIQIQKHQETAHEEGVELLPTDDVILRHIQELNAKIHELSQNVLKRRTKARKLREVPNETSEPYPIAAPQQDLSQRKS